LEPGKIAISVRRAVARASIRLWILDLSHFRARGVGKRPSKTAGLLHEEQLLGVCVRRTTSDYPRSLVAGGRVLRVQPREQRRGAFRERRHLVANCLQQI